MTRDQGTGRGIPPTSLSSGGLPGTQLGSRLRRHALDLRILGPGAPIRAAYEASKRLGGHRLVFGAMPPRHRARPTLQVAWPLPPHVPDAARSRCLTEAAEIAGGRVRVFGQELTVGAAPDWHLIHDGPGRWPVVDWWRIDIRSACRRGDVKWAWELGRHRHLVILARAHHCEPDDPRWIETLGGHLRSWLVSNPLEMGIHWYSNLEVALRSLNWLQVLALTGKALDPGLRADMEHVLYHSGFHLAADLPYTLSTMRNNHLLGDALGLVALGTSFPHDGHARRWLGLGRQLFDWQLRRHFRDDGSSVEDSLSYHRFVLEMLAALLLLREAPQARRRLAAGSELLARLGAIEGPVPAYGDWDEGRVLASSGDPLDVGGTARLGLALGGTAAVPEPWYEDFDEVAWYAPPRPESGTAPTRYRNPWEQRSEPAPRPKQRRSTPVPEPGGFDVGAHIARAGSGGFVCWLKAGAAPSHGHADLTSVSLWRNGRWLTGDPGTGSYNGSIERRNYFRSSLAHNVLRLEGRDQLVPHRAFRWQQRAQGHLGAPLRLGELVVMWGGHDAYRTLDAPRRVVRAAALCPSGLSVIDWVDGQPGVPYALSIPLGPEISWEQDQATLPDGDVIRVDIPVDSARVAFGTDAPYDGWWSQTYGEAEASVRLGMEGVVQGPVCWTMRTVGSPAPIVEGPAVVLGSMTLALAWSAEGARLTMTVEGEHQTLSSELTGLKAIR